MAEKIKINFLGTGSSIPTARRNHTGMLIRYKNETILMDCGEGIQRQFRKARLNPCKVTKILFSHWHADHSLGLPGLLYTLVMNGYNRELEIYGPKGSKEMIRKLMDLHGFDSRKLKLSVHEVKDEIFFDTAEFYLEAKSMDHSAPTNGYSFVLKEKSRLDKGKLKKLKISNSPLIGDLAQGKKVLIDGKKVDGKKMVYTEPSRKVSFVVDSRYNENAVKLASGADFFVCESSFAEGEEEIAADHGHMTSMEAVKIARKAKVSKLALIHLSQRYDAIPKKILMEAKKGLKGTKIEVRVPEDLDSVEL